MAQNKNTRKSQGLCRKIHNAVSPFRSKTRRISHQPQGSISVTSDKKPPSQITENPVRISSPQTKPVHVLHQPGQSKMTPAESDPPAAHFYAQNTKKLLALSPVVQSSGKENCTGKPVQEFADRGILVIRGQKIAKSASRKTELAPPEKVEKFPPTEDKPLNHAPFAKARSKKDDDSMHEGKFSDYISKVKNRFMKTASNIGGGGGGGGGGGTSPRRDSFNDNVTNYINHARIKIRTTTNVGDEMSLLSQVKNTSKVKNKA